MAPFLLEIILVVAILLANDPNPYTTQIQEPSVEICLARAEQAFIAMQDLHALGFEVVSVTCQARIGPPA